MPGDLLLETQLVPILGDPEWLDGPPAEKYGVVTSVRPDERSLARIEDHWSGWSLEGWAVRFPEGAASKIVLFDARAPESLLLEVTLDPARGARWLGTAMRFGILSDGATRHCDFQLLALEPDRVRVVARRRITEDRFPPRDEEPRPGWTEGRTGASWFGGGFPPVIAAWSWNGSLSDYIAQDLLWPAAPGNYTAVFDTRDRDAWNKPLPSWPHPVWLLAVERPQADAQFLQATSREDLQVSLRRKGR
jgi:hypothetical protein